MEDRKEEVRNVELMMYVYLSFFAFFALLHFCLFLSNIVRVFLSLFHQVSHLCQCLGSQPFDLVPLNLFVNTVNLVNVECC